MHATATIKTMDLIALSTPRDIVYSLVQGAICPPPRAAVEYGRAGPTLVLRAIRRAAFRCIPADVCCEQGAGGWRGRTCAASFCEVLCRIPPRPTPTNAKDAQAPGVAAPTKGRSSGRDADRAIVLSCESEARPGTVFVQGQSMTSTPLHAAFISTRRRTPRGGSVGRRTQVRSSVVGRVSPSENKPLHRGNSNSSSPLTKHTSRPPLPACFPSADRADCACVTAPVNQQPASSRAQC